MIETDIQLMTTLGVIVILLILIIIITLLVKINGRQNKLLLSLYDVIGAINSLSDSVTNNEIILDTNFKELSSSNLVSDAKQTSIKDSLDIIAKGIELYHNKTVELLSPKMKSNHPSGGTKTPRKRNTPTLGNHGAGSRK